MDKENKAELGDELYHACSIADLSAIQAFIKHQISLNPSYVPPLSTVMSVAAFYDQASIVSWCLAHGAAVTDSIMRTVIAGAFKTHKALIEANAVDIDYYVSWFGTVLSVAATDGDYDWTKFCLEKGADPNYPRVVDECKSILAGAAENGKVDIMALLIEYGAKVRGSGALVVAAEVGEIAAVHFLIGKKDLDIDERGGEQPPGSRLTGDKGTALHGAAREGHRDIVELLVERGADLNIEDAWGRTALDVARENERVEIVEYVQGQNVT
jgi:ankyrin repeat protein